MRWEQLEIVTTTWANVHKKAYYKIFDYTTVLSRTVFPTLMPSSAYLLPNLMENSESTIDAKSWKTSGYTNII